jgi:hypothetical protein
LERVERGFQLFERKRHALAQGDGRSMVIDSDREQLHTWGGAMAAHACGRRSYFSRLL